MKPLALLLAMAALTSAQEFEVASIRPAVQDGNQDSDSDNGRFRTHNLTLKRLIAHGWDVDESEVLGGPNWTDTDSWDIDAKIPAEYVHRTPEQMRQMIRGLLANRFQLAVHREPRQVSGFALVTAKNGPRMKPAKPNGRGSGFSTQNTHMVATDVTMEEFARRLSRSRDIGKLVADKTGLAGPFDFVLDWAREGDTTDDRPSIFTALREQLGVKLESARVTFEAVVIDRAAKPGGN